MVGTGEVVIRQIYGPSHLDLGGVTRIGGA
jgi:hypothetical protein